MSSKKNASTIAVFENKPDVDECLRPEFIYGGPFIKVEKPDPFLTTSTPINLQLQGTFKKSFAYYSLKERLPVILTKVIDQLSRQGSSSGGSADEVQKYIQIISKLKNDLVTNKKYDLFTVNTPEAHKWNEWIEALDNQKYFTNVWVFTECYVYRRLREGCELHKGLNNFDPFALQKNESFGASLEAMCVVAEKMADMLPESDKDKRKADFITLLKVCLWANRCDLSLSVGEPVSMGPIPPPPPPPSKDKNAAPAPEPPVSQPLVDPIQMILDLKDKLLVDDTGKIADQVFAKAETIQKAIEANTTFKFQCSCHRLATAFGMPLQKEHVAAAPEPTGKKGSVPPPPAAPATPAPSPPPEGEEAEGPKVPCPAKMVLPQVTMFDIVCDNAGYELFADLCLAHFLISQKIVQKIRFHVKNMPWFVSDVTKKDFNYVVDACMKANYNRTVQPEPKPEPKEGSEPPEPEPPRTVEAGPLRALAAQWRAYLDDGVFVVMDEDYWTWPHVYKDMKKYDYNLYRKLQYAVAILFKGDLNYRKLLGERNCNPVSGFEAALQGFIPAPIIAVRTVKADLICGLPKGKWDVLNGIDPKWMETGEYGVIQFCPKAEPLKPSDRPCIDYGDSCFGEVCPTHTDM